YYPALLTPSLCSALFPYTTLFRSVERNATKMKKSTILYIYSGLLFILFFDLWVENSEQASNFFGIWIKPFIDEPKFSLVWSVLAIDAMVVLFKYILDAREEEKRDLEKT